VAAHRQASDGIGVGLSFGRSAGWRRSSGDAGRARKCRPDHADEFKFQSVINLALPDAPPPGNEERVAVTRSRQTPTIASFARLTKQLVEFDPIATPRPTQQAWRQLVVDCNKFVTLPEGWVRRAADLGWEAVSVRALDAEWLCHARLNMRPADVSR
jgi:hypothetical protein